MNQSAWCQFFKAGMIGVFGGLALSVSSAAQSQDNLMVYFNVGSSSITGEQAEVLDQAARLFREGSPLVMILSGGTDTLGPAALNLALSVERAQVVLNGLVERGIPIDRLQIAGRGETDLVVDTEDSVAEAGNRYVEITWR